MKNHGPLTSAELLQVGHWFQRENRFFEIMDWDSKEPLVIKARVSDTDAIQRFTLAELFAPTPITRFAETYDELVAIEGSKDAMPSKSVDAATLPANLVSRAEKIIETVKAVHTHMEELRRQHQLATKPFSLTDITCQACQALAMPVSLSAYYAYRKLYQLNNGDS